eukprot:TRINITY_DN5349_c0_g1_i1.p1 TRINITY_DN5349_c0_g1~~TRINITY_DN5349_c0_g1_i1.p1  ORF type:complete len:359 (-),score=100.82 TRINITY_DN5349_c0_g1_i1:52-1128(-)
MSPSLSSSSLSSLSVSGTPLSPSPSPDYSFSGMHHIFGECTKAVTHIRFGVGSTNIFAFVSRDLVIYLCMDVYHKPGVTFQLKGHTAEITDICFTGTNTYLASSSLDGSLRIWETKTGTCSQFVREVGVCSSIVFHPKIDMLLLASDNKANVKIVSFKEGKIIKSFKVPTSITSLAFEPSGGILFGADEKGQVQIYKGEKDGLSYSLSSRTQVLGPKTIPITSFKFIYLKMDRTLKPFVLVNAKDNLIRIFTVKSTSPSSLGLVPFREIPVLNKTESIHSSFCPAAVYRDAPCLVTGSEDCTIYFHDVKRRDIKPLNKLIGHGAPVVDVCWSHDEVLLASADTSGTVILWARVKIGKT